MFRAKFIQRFKTHILYSKTCPPPTPKPEDHAIYEIVWGENMVEPDRPQLAIWRRSDTICMPGN